LIAQGMVGIRLRMRIPLCWDLHITEPSLIPFSREQHNVNSYTVTRDNIDKDKNKFKIKDLPLHKGNDKYYV
jgi:hypothetical protein